MQIANGIYIADLVYLRVLNLTNLLKTSLLILILPNFDKNRNKCGPYEIWKALVPTKRQFNTITMKYTPRFALSCPDN